MWAAFGILSALPTRPDGRGSVIKRLAVRERRALGGAEIDAYVNEGKQRNGMPRPSRLRPYEASSPPTRRCHLLRQ